MRREREIAFYLSACSRSPTPHTFNTIQASATQTRQTSWKQKNKEMPGKCSPRNQKHLAARKQRKNFVHISVLLHAFSHKNGIYMKFKYLKQALYAPLFACTKDILWFPFCQSWSLAAVNMDHRTHGYRNTWRARTADQDRQHSNGAPRFQEELPSINKQTT